MTSISIDEITQKVRTIIAHHACLPSSDTVGLSQVMDDFGFDSLDHVEVAIAIEDVYRINIPDRDMFGDTTTVEQIIVYVAKRLGVS